MAKDTSDRDKDFLDSIHKKSSNYERIRNELETYETEIKRVKLRGAGASKRFRASKPKKLKLKDDKEFSESVGQEWHCDAFHAYELVPEVASIVDQTAKLLASCKFRVGRKGPDGCPKETDQQAPNKVLRDLEGPLGGQRSLFEAMARNLQITGDGYLVGKAVYDDPENRNEITKYSCWEFLSIDELTVSTTDGGVDQYGNPSRKNVYSRNPDGSKSKNQGWGGEKSSGKKTVLDTESGEYYVIRIWRQNPRYSQLSDSALKKNLPILKELLKLTDLINAIANSRLSAGILIIPEEFNLETFDETVDPGEIMSGEGKHIGSVHEDLSDHMRAPVEDRSDPSSIVPLVVSGPAEFVEFVKLVETGRSIDHETRQIRNELLDRLASGMDAPKESMSGIKGLNHWSGFLVESKFASQHILPLGELISSYLTIGYLQPELIRRGMDPQDACQYCVMFDASKITARADEATIARKLFELNAISEEALLRYSGFEITDAPTQNERRQSLILKLILASPVTLAPFLLPLIDGLEHIGDLLVESRENGTALPSQNKRASETGGDDGRGKRLPSIAGKDLDNPKDGRNADPTGKPPDTNRDNDKTPGGDQEDGRAPTTSNSTLRRSLETYALTGENFEEVKELLSSSGLSVPEFVEISPAKDELSRLNQIEELVHSVEGIPTREAEEALISRLTTSAHIARSSALKEASKNIKERIISAGTEELKGRIENVPDENILTIVRGNDISNLGVEVEDLLGNFDELAENITEWMLEWGDDLDVSKDDIIQASAIMLINFKDYIHSTLNLGKIKLDNSMSVPSEIAEMVVVGLLEGSHFLEQ